MRAPTLLVAAASSGSGKTVTVAGMLRAYLRRGLRVTPAKSGPDYIDPRFHAAAARRAGPNLDTWAMPPGLVSELLAEATSEADLVLIESAMGLFDGAPLAAGSAGSAADLAGQHGVPVLLVLDVARQFQTAAAIVRGLATHDPRVRVVGVMLNRVAGERHSGPIVRAIEAQGIPVVGCIPQNETLALPSRHLGLVQAEEFAELDTWLDRLAELMEAELDLDAVLEIARGATAGSAVSEREPAAGDAGRSPSGPAAFAAVAAPGRRVALASDAAFSFMYPHVLQAWERRGVEVVRFSPLADEPPPPECDACWLPGGYPELHAASLSRARTFRAGLQEFARSRPVHGECGGYMVLGRALEDADGVQHAMTGLLGHTTSFAKRRLHIGYREARWRTPLPAGFHGERVRGHEFHYAVVTDSGADAPCADLFDASGQALGPAGGRRGRVTGTFFHAIAEWPAQASD